MKNKKVIVVIGATGLQGSGLVNAILADPDGEFKVRSITRDPDSEKARALAAQGVEVVKGDIGDLQSLQRAFQGAYGAFVVSFFWHHADAKRDLQEIENMALAAKHAKLQHVIYSTLEDSREFYLRNGETFEAGQYRAAHLDVKGEGDRFFKDYSVPTTYLLTTFYWDNFLNQGVRPTRVNGVARINFPMADKKLVGIASEDIGKSAYGIFKNGKTFINKRVGISGEHLTGAEYAQKLSAALGEQITYAPPTLEEFRGYNVPFGEDVANSFQFMIDFDKEFAEIRDVELTRLINPELKSFNQWLAQNKHLIQID